MKHLRDYEVFIKKEKVRDAQINPFKEADVDDGEWRDCAGSILLDIVRKESVEEVYKYMEKVWQIDRECINVVRCSSELNKNTLIKKNSSISRLQKCKIDLAFENARVRLAALIDTVEPCEELNLVLLHLDDLYATLEQIKLEGIDKVKTVED